MGIETGFILLTFCLKELLLGAMQFLANIITFVVVKTVELIFNSFIIDKYYLPLYVKRIVDTCTCFMNLFVYIKFKT